MDTYTLATRPDGDYIYIHVPEIDYGTQARHAGEIERMGRDLIATVLDLEPEDFAVRIVQGS